MTDWWNSLSIIQQIFYGIGIVSLTITGIQLLLTLFGLGSDSLDLEFDSEIGDSDHSSGLGIFSVQTISAFFMAFGWSGVAGTKLGAPIALTIVLAFAFGTLTMIGMYFLIRAVLKLQGKGNLKYDTAIGQVATVYVTIPGGNEDGGGQIELTIQGRHRTASARKQAPGAIKPGQQVKITGMLTDTSFLVEEI